jgi:hypothetical protein
VIPVRLESGVVWVDVNSSSASSPLHFLLDSGARHTTISDDAARRFRVATGWRAAGSGLGDAGMGVISNLKASCGNVPLARMALCADLTNISLRCGRMVDGLLGADFLKGQSIMIDIADGRLLLKDSADAVASLGAGLPFEMRDGRIWVRISSPGSARPLRFLLDTACARTTIDTATAMRLGLSRHGRDRVCVVGGTVLSQQATVVASLGGMRLPSNVLVTDLTMESLQANRHVDGIVGVDFIKGHRIGLDFRTRTLAFADAKPDAGAGERVAMLR